MMRLRSSPRLTRETVARSRALRRAMTEAELVLWRGLGEALPDARFRTQTPLGPYYADFVSHRCRLVIEVDGGQHGEKLEYDAARTHFMNGEGYRVLRFWNNEVLRNLDGVLAAIAAQIPSPLVGEGGAKRRMGGARRSRVPAAARPLAAAKEPSAPATGESEVKEARRSRAPASAAGTPTPRPPHKGEGAKRQTTFGVS